MAHFCSTCIFLTYVSGTFVFLVLGIFAATGNKALLMENYIYDENRALKNEERSRVKGRATWQYFLSSIFSLAISIAVFIIFLRNKGKPTSETINTAIDDSGVPDFKNVNEMITERPEESPKTSNDSLDIRGSIGMSEKDPVI